MNATLVKFGYPASLIAEYVHWCVLLRPAQPTLGSLILGAKSDATSFAALAPQAFVELGVATARIERGLRAFRNFDKINYLMLMMVDPHVHFHVLPRYSGTQRFAGLDFPDKGWPGLPDLATAITPSPVQAEEILTALRTRWPKD